MQTLAGEIGECLMKARSTAKAAGLDGSRALQRVLYRSAKQNPSRRFMPSTTKSPEAMCCRGPGTMFVRNRAGPAWMGSSVPGGLTVPRGPWRYDGEIDLGFGGALRMAATVVTNDPLFGWFAYGGALTERGDSLAVNPRDGLRRRFDVVVPDIALPFPQDVRRLKIELDRDGFAADGLVMLDKTLRRIAFTIENRTGNAHVTAVRLSLPSGASYDVRVNGTPVPLSRTGDWDYPWRADVSIVNAATHVELVRR